MIDLGKTMPDRPRRALGVIALAASGLAACGRADHAQAPPPPVVQIASVHAAAGASALEATGALRRTREVTLAFRTAGVITRLLVDDGDAVRAGQVLAEIDDDVLAARYRQAQAELARAEADNRRAAELATRGAASQQQADAAASQLAAARAAFAAAAFDQRWTRLVAPAAGVVLARTAQAGETVQPGQPVVSVADLGSPLVLRASLADKDAARLRLGAPAEVTVDGSAGGALAGRVSRIAQRADARTGAVEFEVTLPERRDLRSGLIGRVRIPVATPQAGAFDRVPAEAVLEADKAQAFVMRYDPGHGVARKIAVRFAGFDGDDALVADLPRGAQVITAGAGFIGDGQRVTVVAAAQGSGR